MSFVKDIRDFWDFLFIIIIRLINDWPRCRANARGRASFYYDEIARANADVDVWRSCQKRYVLLSA